MEIIATLVSLVILALIVAAPILILVKLDRLKITYRLGVFLIAALLISSLLTLTYSWWVDTSKEILLSHYGYDFEGSNAERMKYVSKENVERVKQLEISRMGIGWPLKALMIYRIYWPYLLGIYLIAYLMRKRISAH